MIDFVIGHYGYWFVIALLTIGLWGMLAKKNLVKKLIGMNIFQASVIMFYIASTTKWNATVPIIDPAVGSADATHYINPLPHTLMLTAIVVSVATTGVAFALLIMIYRRFKTLDEPTLLERMK
ncbi:MAG: NADH-quinone oxidoreductase subunit J [Ignavibacteria bacterium]|nr:NADH-quinone oxidoreductase subunit J [Ignavibacteria bacterium]